MTLIKQLKKHKISFPESETVALSFSRPEIEKMLPHRSPFFFLDQISRLNLKEQCLEGFREIATTDPIFQGHFPQNPIYPGVLQIEMMGQLGLCLYHFIQNQSSCLPQESKPLTGLFTKVHHASFLQPIFPGDRITILAQMEEYDDWTGTVKGQIYKGEELCSFSILGVYFNE